MAYSRMGTVSVKCVAVDLHPLVREVCQMLQAKNPHSAVVVWRVAEDLPSVQADATLLRQALEHVLGNAVKFSAPRAVPQIEVGWEVDTLFVRDNGVGFNPAMQAKLFHVFQRLHSQREFEGIGMGLALTRKIIERHGGSVLAQGAVDAGCCIRLRLPAH
jgi:light-regulated signal transduction histidine kinase (bacteriophytochrome)